ncbi:Glia maturation factor beta [Schistosoma japonicum]|nr:Glia maturation factor beta [Schistosoma japonicum]
MLAGSDYLLGICDYHKQTFTMVILFTTNSLSTSIQSELRVAEISENTADSLKKFKFRKYQNTAAFICLKIDKETLTIEPEQILEDTTLDDLNDSLPHHQPRYILLSYRYEKEDGRVTFPYCLLFSTPVGSATNLKMMYATSLSNLMHKSEVTKVFELRDLEELSDTWLKENLDRT